MTDFTFKYPLALAIAWENLISMFKLFASLTTELLELSLISITIGLIPFFLKSIAVSYALSLLVKIIGFLPTKTP